MSQDKTKEDAKTFVKNFIDSYEPDTFNRNERGELWYTSGHSGINLTTFFEELLEDYIDSNPLQHQLSEAKGEIERLERVKKKYALKLMLKLIRIVN